MHNLGCAALGCFFDDFVHASFGMKEAVFGGARQCLYGIAIGGNASEEDLKEDNQEYTYPIIYSNAATLTLAKKNAAGVGNNIELVRCCELLICSKSE